MGPMRRMIDQRGAQRLPVTLHHVGIAHPQPAGHRVGSMAMHQLAQGKGVAQAEGSARAVRQAGIGQDFAHRAVLRHLAPGLAAAGGREQHLTRQAPLRPTGQPLPQQAGSPGRHRGLVGGGIAVGRNAQAPTCVALARWHAGWRPGLIDWAAGRRQHIGQPQRPQVTRADAGAQLQGQGTAVAQVLPTSCAGSRGGAQQPGDQRVGHGRAKAARRIGRRHRDRGPGGQAGR